MPIFSLSSFINDVTDNDSVIEITNRHTSYCSHIVTIVKKINKCMFLTAYIQNDDAAEV